MILARARAPKEFVLRPTANNGGDIGADIESRTPAPKMRQLIVTITLFTYVENAGDICDACSIVFSHVLNDFDKTHTEALETLSDP